MKESRVKTIVSTKISAISDEQRKMKNLALQGFPPDPNDPRAAKILEAQKQARKTDSDKDFNLTLTFVSKSPSTNQLKRQSARTPDPKSAKKLKGNSTTPEAKEAKGQLNELKHKLRDTEFELKSARD